VLARGRGDDGGVEGTGAGASLLSVEAQLRHEVAKGLEELTGRVLRVKRGPPAAAELCRSSLDCRPIKTPLAVFERRGEAWGGGDRHQRRRGPREVVPL
jgi:hypothetical protein